MPCHQHHIHTISNLLQNGEFRPLSIYLVNSECALYMRVNLECTSVSPPPVLPLLAHLFPSLNGHTLPWPGRSLTKSPHSQTERQKCSIPKEASVWSSHLVIGCIFQIVASSCQVEVIGNERQRCEIVISGLRFNST